MEDSNWVREMKEVRLTDVDEDRLDLRLGEHDLERLLDGLGGGSSSDVEEVCEMKGTRDDVSSFCDQGGGKMSCALAGSPPLSLRTSIVAMASPAPFTRHPMFPSSSGVVRQVREGNC